MKCPKNRTVELVEGTLTHNLAVKHCPDCQGNWIPPDEYDAWRGYQSRQLADPAYIRGAWAEDFVPSEYDSKAGLCPSCSRYLARAKVMVKNPFYVERCPSCGGIWCDEGEWEVLEALGLHDKVEQLFSGQWQAEVRSMQYSEKERQALIEKLGAQLAEHIFELADVLESHPNGDFGVAYLMRRFDKPQ